MLLPGRFHTTKTCSELGTKPHPTPAATVGMSAEVLARAFEPFFTTKPSGKGNGLGLSQVYAVAQESGGTARIESEPGLGTTIRIFLPRAQGISLRTQNPSDHAIHPARGSVFSNTQAIQTNASRSNETL
jgi:Histidine kinase-, DNA gyrase B-, and HSP90-like ATPase